MNTYFLCKKNERGVSLAIALIFMLLISIIGISTMRTAILEQRMAQNTTDGLVAYSSAELALNAGLEHIKSSATIPDFFANRSSNSQLEISNRNLSITTVAYVHLNDDGVRVRPTTLNEVPTDLFNSACTGGYCNGVAPWRNIATLATANRFSLTSTVANVASQPYYIIEYLPGLSEIRRTYQGFYEYTSLNDVEPITYHDTKMYIPANTPGASMHLLGSFPLVIDSTYWNYAKSCWDTFGIWRNIPGAGLVSNACVFDGQLNTHGELMNYRNYRRGQFWLQPSAAGATTSAIELDTTLTFGGPTETTGWRVKTGSGAKPTVADGELTRANQGQVYEIDDPDCNFSTQYILTSVNSAGTSINRAAHRGDQVLGLPNCVDKDVVVDTSTPLTFLRPNYRYRSYYRVTAVGWGAKSETRVVLQQVFYREIYQWNGVTKAEAESPTTNNNIPLRSCDFPNNSGVTCANGAVNGGFVGFPYPASHINANRNNMSPGHAKAFFWSGGQCSHWLGREDLKWKMPSNAPANAAFVWNNPDAFKRFAPMVIEGPGYQFR